jgi:hypothetical protein
VSLDLKNLWFREAIVGDSWSSTAMMTAVANIAPFQMTKNMFDGMEAMAEGDIATGAKKMLPAFFRGFATAAQAEMEGATTAKGDTFIKPEDITFFDTARSVIGGRSLRLANVQDYAITRAANDKKIRRERDKVFKEFNKLREAGEFADTANFRKFWLEEVVPFNRTYPHEDFVITLPSLIRSAKSSETVDAQTYQGMRFSNKAAAKDLEMARPFLIK